MNLSDLYRPYKGGGLVSALALTLLLCASMPAHALERVSLQLKHTHQFQFAGYYAALEKGYYRDAGLDVQITEGRNGNDPERRVIDGSAQYGIGSSSVLLARAAGKPLVVLAVILQHSPYALLVRKSGAQSSIKDIVGKRVMIGSLTNELTQADELMAYLKKEGIPLSSLVRVEHTYQTNDLISGKVDAMSAYVTNEPDYLDRVGFAYDTYSPRAAGIDFYGDNLFTSEREIEDHPQRVKAFRSASLKGWAYAMAHREEMADLILARYTRKNDREHLLFEARQMEALVQPVLVEMGYMNPERWRHIANVYADLGMLPRDLSFDGFLYDSSHNTERTVWLNRLMLGLTLLLLGGAAVHITLLARERQRAQDIISKGELRFRAMFEKAPMGIALIDSASGQFTDINPRYAQVTGRTLEQIKAGGQSCHTDPV